MRSGGWALVSHVKFQHLKRRVLTDSFECGTTYGLLLPLYLFRLFSVQSRPNQVPGNYCMSCTTVWKKSSIALMSHVEVRPTVFPGIGKQSSPGVVSIVLSCRKRMVMFLAIIAVHDIVEVSFRWYLSCVQKHHLVR